MRLYVHYECADDSSYDFCCIVNSESDTDVGNIFLAFQSAFEDHFPGMTIEGRPIHRVEDGTDVFVKGRHVPSKRSRTSEGGSVMSHSPAASSAKPSSPSIVHDPSDPLELRREREFQARQKQASGSSLSINFAKLKKLQASAQQHFSEQHYKSALADYEALLEFPFDRPSVYRNMAQVYLFAGRADRAWDMVRCAQVANSNDVSILEARANVLMALRRYGDCMKTISDMERRIPSSEAEKRHRASALRGRCLYEMGKRAEAFQVATGVLRQTNMEDPIALEVYGTALLEINNDPKEALMIFVRSLVKDQGNQRLKKRVAEILASDDGMRLVSGLFGGKGAPEDDPQFASTVFWLSAVVRDFGYLARSAELVCDMCLRADPGNPMYVLEAVDILALLGNSRKAFRAILRCLRVNAKVPIISDSKRRPLLSAGDILAAVRDLPLGHLANSPKMRGVRLSADSAAWLSDSPTCLVGVGNRTRSVYTLPKEEAASAEHAKGPRISFGEKQGKQRALFSLALTLVRLLFVDGLIFPWVPRLVAVMESFRRRIRGIDADPFLGNLNEYYRVASELALYHQSVPAPAIGESVRPLFVVGGVDVLPFAFAHITLPAGERRLVPCAIPEFSVDRIVSKEGHSIKTAFRDRLSNLPFSAEVLLVSGGNSAKGRMEKAVERLAYPSVAEGIAEAAGSWLRVVRELRSRKEFSLAVLPVLPTKASVIDYSDRWNAAMADGLRAAPMRRTKFLAEAYTAAVDASTKLVREEFVLPGGECLSPVFVKDVLEGVLHAAFQ